MAILRRPLPKKVSGATVTKPVRRALPKTTASKPAKKAAPAKAAPASTPKAAVERDEYGITVGTDQSVILAEMVKGGKDKHEVITRCNAIFDGQMTPGGKPKPVSTVVNQLIHTMGERGFTVESTWRIVPPADGVILPARKRTPSKAKATPAKKAAPSTKDKPAVTRRKLPKPSRTKAST